ncbi:hypothetical protein AAVH_29166, partial [Aphelenchoides avenae]
MTSKSHDVKCVAMLHVYAICGYYERNWNLPDDVMQKVFPKEKPANKTDEQWLEAQREKRFILGVLGDEEGRIEAHHLLGFPHFENAAKSLPTGHSLKPTSGSLQDKYKAGNATLKLRDEMKDELEHWPMAAAADHAKFDVYPTLLPVGYACVQAEDEAATNKICPAGSLYTEEQMKTHAHDANGKPIKAEQERAVELSANATDEQKKVFEVVRKPTPAGLTNY